jgi:hypothetical protein
MKVGRAWLAEAIQELSVEPERIRALFPAVSRHVGRGPVTAGDDRGLAGGCMDDVARAELVAVLPWRGQRLVDDLNDLYRFGDGNEKRGVLRSLHLVDEPYGSEGIGPACVPLVLDALRSNDTRLVAAAVGAYGTTHLDDSQWRQAILKCVFTGVPLAVVHRLHERADGELARMLVDYARERMAAGRVVPRDVWLVLDEFPEYLHRLEPSAALTASVRTGTTALEA